MDCGPGRTPEARDAQGRLRATTCRWGSGGGWRVSHRAQDADPASLPDGGEGVPRGWGSLCCSHYPDYLTPGALNPSGESLSRRNSAGGARRRESLWARRVNVGPEVEGSPRRREVQRSGLGSLEIHCRRSRRAPFPPTFSLPRNPTGGCWPCCSADCP